MPADPVPPPKYRRAAITVEERGGFQLEPQFDANGRVRALVAESPPGPNGGTVAAVLEPCHAEGCKAEAGGACGCGAREAFERLVTREVR